MNIRQTVHFSGRVQGVGFRFTTVAIARGFDVAGRVRNLPDGRVRLEAEGARDQVKAFVDAVRARMEGCVDRCLIDESTATGEFGDPGAAGSFTVAY